MLPLYFAIVGSLIAIPLDAPTQVAQITPISQDRAIELALSNNRRLRAAVLEVVAAQHGVSSASAMANPEVTVSPGFTEGASDEELMVSLPLEINGTRAARTAAARARLKEIRAEAVRELREVVYEVRIGHSALARAQAHLLLAQGLAQHAHEMDRVAQRQAELGSRPGIDRAQTVIEAARAEQQVSLAISQLAGARATLNALIGRRPTDDLVADPLSESASQVQAPEGLLESAMKQRTELQASAAVRDAYLQEARLARAEGLPDIAPHFRAESITRSPRTTGFGVSITVPLFDLGSRRGRIAQAEARARAEQERTNAVKSMIEREVVDAAARLTAAAEALSSFRREALAESHRLLDATRAGFQLGETSVLALLEAQRTYRAFQAEYLDLLALQAQAAAEVERATGAFPEDRLASVPLSGGNR